MPQAILTFVTAAFVTLGASGTIAAIGAYALAGAITVGISIGVNALLGALFGPARPKPSDGQQTTREAVGSRKRHYGIVHTGGQLTFLESANGTLAQVVTLGTGEESEILEHRINDEPVTLDAGGTVTEASYHGAVHIYTRPGDPDQAAIDELTAIFPEWTADHRQRGCAHAAIVADPVEQELFSEVYNGRVPQYTQVRKAAKLYDPRKDSTRQIGTDAGGDPIFGAGAHRIDNDATWEWSDNAALVIADYFGHPDGYGGGFENVNYANIAAEADASDVPETTVEGEVIARWRIWASYSLAREERRHILSALLAACDGFCWQDAEGKFNLMTGRYEAPDVTITDDHILGMTATIGPKARHRVSAVKMLYTEAEIGYREQESATIANPDVEDDPNTDPQVVEAFEIPHHNQAARVGKIFVRQMGDRWHVTAVLNLFALNLLGRRFCRFESEQLGVSADFKIDRLKLQLVGNGDTGPTVEVELWEIEEEDWNFDAATEEGTPPLATGDTGGPAVISAPTGLTLSAVQIALGTSNGVAISASWDAGRAGLTYDAQYRPSAGGDWVAMTVDDANRTARSGPVDSGTEYEVRVRARTLTGRASAWSASETITPTAANTVQPPTNLAAAPGAAGEAVIDWRNPTSGPFDHVKLFENTASDFGTAAQIGPDQPGAPGALDSYTATGLSAATHYFWARAYDAAGNPSAVTGPVSAVVT